MAACQGAVYCTILLSDNYLPGAMVLAHSLKDNGTKGRLAVLITPDTLKPSTIDELKTVYHEVIPIAHLENPFSKNLYLMDRPDLISTFSKIALWKQTQYDQIVYIDADAIAIRAPDELLTLNVTSVAAVPDIGWPDCFNSGVMVLRPNLKDYHSLLAYAQRGISFDGADQGLLNMHFKNWDRLSFAYNCTPSGHYQYIPAFRYFESTISVVHFIGPLKPWRIGRRTSPQDSPYNQLLSKWWAVYDRHYGAKLSHTRSHTLNERTVPSPMNQESRQVESIRTSEVQSDKTKYAPQDVQLSTPERVTNPKFFDTEPTIEHIGQIPTKIEAPDIRVINPDEIAIHYDAIVPPVYTDASTNNGEENFQKPSSHPILSSVPQYVRGEEHASVPIYRGPTFDIPSQHIPRTNFELTTPHATTSSEDSEHFDSHGIQTPASESSRKDERPSSRQNTQVETTAPNIQGAPPPERTFSPPLAVWDASRAPPPVDSKPEAVSFPVQIYTMSKDTELFQPPQSYPEAPKNMYYEVPTAPPATQEQTSAFPWERGAPAATRVFLGGERKPRPVSRSFAESISQYEEGGFDSYSRNNAWDDMPEIERYMRSIQKPRRAGVSIVSGTKHSRSSSTGSKSSVGKSNLRLTHFPPENEHPSPAVTPSLVMRGQSLSYRGGDGGRNENLPVAEGVPSQREWNPIQRLKELQRRQSQFLENPPDLRSLKIPKRQMPGESSSSS